MMLQESIQTLEKTPLLLRIILRGVENTEVSLDYIKRNLSHLIEGEKTYWLPNIRILLNEKDEELQDIELDRNQDTKKSLQELLDNFDLLRQQSIFELRNIAISGHDLKITGRHKTYGNVKVKNLLANWVYHDQVHISLVIVGMGERFRRELGPYEEKYSNDLPKMK